MGHSDLRVDKYREIVLASGLRNPEPGNSYSLAYFVVIPSPSLSNS